MQIVMYYSAEDPGCVDSATAKTRRSKAQKISAGVASLITYLRKQNLIFATLKLLDFATIRL